MKEGEVMFIYREFPIENKNLHFQGDAEMNSA